MTFQPIIPIGGLGGWQFLKRTQAVQEKVQQSNPVQKRDESWFREKIGKITSAKDLVADHRLLRVALAAFGLEGDLANKAFVRKILEDGTSSPSALSNRLANKSYRAFAETFDYSGGTSPVAADPGLVDRVVNAWHARQFETAVGTQNNGFRLALNGERELADLAGKGSSEDTKWLTIMGNLPLREFVQTALGLPSGISKVDLDRQLGAFRQAATRIFGDGSVSQFSAPDKLSRLTRLFLVRSETAGGSQSPAQMALQLLGRR